MRAEDDSDQRPSVRRRWPRVAGTVVLVVAMLLAALWLARKPLATRYTDRFLASKGVAARYRLIDLGLGRQRLVDVVLGDPADPDLVADWLEARTAVGIGGPYLTGVRGGRIRLRARLVRGRVSLGSLDRLLPPPSGKAFALPTIDLDVGDARVRLETSAGVVGLKLAGSGRLDGGFAGRIAVTSGRLGSTCAVTDVQAVLAVRTAGGLLGRPARVRLDGPIRTDKLVCAGVRVAAARATVAGEAMLGDRPSWTARTTLATGGIRHARGDAASFGGTIAMTGDAGSGRGTVDLRADQPATAQVRARAVTVAGALAFDRAGVGVGQGQPATMHIMAAQLAPDLLHRADAVAPLGRGTPIAPLLVQLARAGKAAGGSFDVSATIGAVTNGGGGTVDLRTLEARSRSGAQARWDGHASVRWGERASTSATGQWAVSGGGLPTAQVRVVSDGHGVRGTATVASYAAADARLAVTPVTFVADRRGMHVRMTARLSGPLGDGRVEELSLPIDLVWRGDELRLDPGCVPLGWGRVAVSGLTLDRGGVRLCATAGALIAVAGNRLTGGATIGATRLTGRLGATPLTLAMASGRVGLGDRGFAMTGVAARLGRPERLTRLDIANLDGRWAEGALAGRFDRAGGQIGAVPLLLSQAAGRWSLAAGALRLDGGLTVSDAQADRPRFRPMPVRDVALTLAAGTIRADGVVHAPGPTARKLADVKLVHDLKQGAGAATFVLPGLLFDKALQPDQLTPLTFGVIADVRGTVAGDGRIGWSNAGVTSTGVFRTADTDLAAAFGPVEGIAAEIRFTDLLALRSAPGQVAHVRSVNPGIAVTDGTIRFQTLPDARVQVEGGQWPFAGGRLTLEPTLLDFSAAAQRRMTFRVAGMAADQFLQQFDFKNLDATGTFDGVLPMVFDQSGGRIVDGRLAVRQGPDGGGGTLAYVGPISQKDIGFWPNLAFQALKSLRYRSLTIAMDGPLAGEMVTAVRFTGISQGEGARRGGLTGLLVGRLQRLPFVFNIRITAPFRGLLDATASFYDPKRLIGRNLPQLLEEQEKRAQPLATESPPIQPPAIQPPASRKVP